MSSDVFIATCSTIQSQLGHDAHMAPVVEVGWSVECCLQPARKLLHLRAGSSRSGSGTWKLTGSHGHRDLPLANSTHELEAVAHMCRGFRRHIDLPMPRQMIPDLCRGMLTLVEEASSRSSDVQGPKAMAALWEQSQMGSCSPEQNKQS